MYIIFNKENAQIKLSLFIRTLHVKLKCSFGINFYGHNLKGCRDIPTYTACQTTVCVKDSKTPGQQGGWQEMFIGKLPGGGGKNCLPTQNSN
jgi:hypothetical protein